MFTSRVKSPKDKKKKEGKGGQTENLPDSGAVVAAEEEECSLVEVGLVGIIRVSQCTSEASARLEDIFSLQGGKLPPFMAEEEVNRTALDLKE